MERLYHRHIVQNPQCQICGASEEDIIHALFECTHTVEIWSQSPLLAVISDAQSTSLVERLDWVVSKVTREEICTVATLRAAWSSRNIRIYEHTNPNAIQLAAGYIRLVET